MSFYRKKPVVIEARRHDSTSWDSAVKIAEWCGGRSVKNEMAHGSHIIISTLEGDMRADLGDWVIKGVSGEFYPCKPDIFEKTYEAVDATA